MKKAKLSQRIRGFFAKIFKKGKETTAGNYRHRNRWSQAAKALAKRPRVWLTEPLAQRAFYSVHGVMDVYVAYSEIYQLQAANLGRALLRDIYTPDVLPILSCGRILSDRESIDLMNQELFELLCCYGGMDLVFYNHTTKTPPRSVLEDANLVPLGQDIYLTSKRHGMAVRDFLLWHKGSVEIPSAVLTEWSGIPETYFAAAYRGLIDFLRNTLINKHREQLATNRIPGTRKKLRDPVIYV